VIRAVDIRPVRGATNVIDPMIAARTILGEEPTKNTNPTITPMVRMLLINFGNTEIKVLKNSLVKIVIFIPDNAAMWSVPVTTSASKRSVEIDAFVPNKIPAKSPAAGSGRTRLIIATNAARVGIL